jgi:hypothetical protein
MPSLFVTQIAVLSLNSPVPPARPRRFAARRRCRVPPAADPGTAQCKRQWFPFSRLLRPAQLILSQNHDEKSIGRTYRLQPKRGLDYEDRVTCTLLHGAIPRCCQYHRPIDSVEHPGCNGLIGGTGSIDKRPEGYEYSTGFSVHTAELTSSCGVLPLGLAKVIS